jgi:hypothetical protein
VKGVKLDGCLRGPGGHPQGVPPQGGQGKVDAVWERTWNLNPLAFSSGRLHGRRSVRQSETFNHPDIAVGDLAEYGEVAAVR